MLDWPYVATLPWRQRNAAIEVAIRKFLWRYRGPPLETADLAVAIFPNPFGFVREMHGKLAQIMARMAPYLGPIATHDGAEIKRYGKTWRRWRWHGQQSIRAQMERVL